VNWKVRWDFHDIEQGMVEISEELRVKQLYFMIIMYDRLDEI